MSTLSNRVRRGFYQDSVGLMRISREIGTQEGIEEAALMMATPANLAILEDAGLLAAGRPAAGPGDLVIAVRARSEALAEAAIAAAEARLDASGQEAEKRVATRPHSLKGALALAPASNLVLISVPGVFAANEARAALAQGLNVMIFSDNVPIEEEAALKREAHGRDLLVMGPDCGTAVIGGVPLAFANEVAEGEIGIIGASGTGIQEVSSLITRLGGGISHAIGTGGRDLSAEVGAITTLDAIDLLDRDPATRVVVLISKPPAAAIARAVLERAARSPKRFIVCFLGADDLVAVDDVEIATTLKEAALKALGRSDAGRLPALPRAPRARRIRGLFAGGTLCAEAQLVLLRAGHDVASNVPVPGAAVLGRSDIHELIDLGADEHTIGRPHPMIEPSIRDAPLDAALEDPCVGIILVDLVLGHGAHKDPAAVLVRVIGDRALREGGPLVIASVTGTPADPQELARQVATLEKAGVVVAPSSADAAHLALEALRP